MDEQPLESHNAECRRWWAAARVWRKWILTKLDGDVSRIERRQLQRHLGYETADMKGWAAARLSEAARGKRAEIAVRSGAWVCDAPPATPDSEGWWWVMEALQNAEPKPAQTWLYEGELHVKVFGWEHSVRADCGLRWGGRLAVNGASQTIVLSNQKSPK